MKMKALGTNLFPILDLEKETKRWNQLYKIMTEPKPEIIPTPRQAVWKKNKATLWYHPAKKKRHAIPVFLVYSLLNKVYILDIGEGSSVVGGLTERGYDVYLLDWGSPGLEDSYITLDNIQVQRKYPLPVIVLVEPLQRFWLLLQSCRLRIYLLPPFQSILVSAFFQINC
jgi:poly(3-hydroxyalkanoate) synthetase